MSAYLTSPLLARASAGLLGIIVLVYYFRLFKDYMRAAITGRTAGIGPAGASWRTREWFTFPELFMFTGRVAGFCLCKAVLGAFPFGMVIPPASELMTRVQLVLLTVVVYLLCRPVRGYMERRLDAVSSVLAITFERGWPMLRLARVLVTNAVLLQGVSIWVCLKTVTYGYLPLAWI